MVTFQDGAEYDRRGNRLKYQKPGYNLDRRSYEVDDKSDRLEQQVRFLPWLLHLPFMSYIVLVQGAALGQSQGFVKSFLGSSSG